MKNSMENVCKIIEQMDRQLREELLKKNGGAWEEKLWENIFIKRQIDRRNVSEKFSLEDHIRAMVYSMISSNLSWDRIIKDIDPESKRIVSVDKIFCGYDVKQLLDCAPGQLRDALKEIKCAGQSTFAQMEALLTVNIPKLQAWEKEYGDIDTYYQKFIEIDGTKKELVAALSASGGKDKMVQMDVALVCEYLRNIGHDIPKPDRHIRRILGSEYLALSPEQAVPALAAFDLVVEMAERMKKPAAEVDYILWSYCADGYGEICTKRTPKCKVCVAAECCGRALMETEDRK